MLEKELLERLQSRPIHVENAERRLPNICHVLFNFTRFSLSALLLWLLSKKSIFPRLFWNNDEKMICGTRFFSARDPSNSTLNHSLISPHKKGGEDLGEASNRENPSFRNTQITWLLSLWLFQARMGLQYGSDVGYHSGRDFWDVVDWGNSRWIDLRTVWKSFQKLCGSHFGSFGGSGTCHVLFFR